MPWFLRVCNKSLLKTPWEKEKLLVTSIFSFSHSVFYPFRKLSAIFIKLEIIVCKLFQLGRVQNLLFGKGLRLYQMTIILSLSKMKAFADDTLYINPKISLVFHRVENIMEKLGNAGYKSFSPFPSMFL